jgi:hypothetical protein
MMERRAARRYDLTLPIIIGAGEGEQAGPQAGKTCVISNRGVYFTIGGALTAGAKLDLTLIVPANVTGTSEVLIRTTGKVVRVDDRTAEGEPHLDVAAEFDAYDIIRNETAVA